MMFGVVQVQGLCDNVLIIEDHTEDGDTTARMKPSNDVFEA